MHDSTSRSFPQLPAAGDASDDNGLSDQQLIAIGALVRGKSFTEAAREAGVDRRTVFNWRRDPRFIEHLHETRRALWSRATEQLRAMVHPALDVLREQLAARYDRTRYRAAHVVLHLANIRKCVALIDDEDREPRA